MCTPASNIDDITFDYLFSKKKMILLLHVLNMFREWNQVAHVVNYSLTSSNLVTFDTEKLFLIFS